MAESPRIRLRSLTRRSRNAHSTTITSVKGSGLSAMEPQRAAMPPRMPSGKKAGRSAAVTKPRDMAMVSAPKPTWLRPSPIIEYRFSTSVTPSSDAHSDTSAPTTSARWMNLY